MLAPDLYSVLGVLPEAEDVVITAAYRALAQRYHPDKRPSEAADSHRRMAEINEAYRVLGDSKLRQDYDRARISSGRPDFHAAERPEHHEAFEEALRDAEDRWAVAVTVIPDLEALRNELAQISTSLAFSFVTTLLESRQYAGRAELAHRLERAFLERFFGTNDRVVAFAKELIVGRYREAARALNRLVDVMGSGVDPDLLISRIEDDFCVRLGLDKIALTSLRRQRLLSAAHRVRTSGDYWNARDLARQLGYETAVVDGGLFRGPSVAVTSPDGQSIAFQNRKEFVNWARAELCPLV